jgi:ferredoxin
MKQLRAVSEKCTECNLCQKECAFLQKFGKPKAIADAFEPSRKDYQAVAFECTLYGLCTAVCPVDIGPARMFLEMREEAVRRGGGDYPERGVILNYEKRGTSRHYTWCGLPEGCDTVFFPGCNLPGTRPGRVMQFHEWLQRIAPSLGIVPDCCMKPSHWNRARLKARFKSMLATAPVTLERTLSPS